MKFRIDRTLFSNGNPKDGAKFANIHKAGCSAGKSHEE